MEVVKNTVKYKGTIVHTGCCQRHVQIMDLGSKKVTFCPECQTEATELWAGEQKVKFE